MEKSAPHSLVEYNLITQGLSLSLDYWLNRIAVEAEKANEPIETFIPTNLLCHRDRILTLILKSESFPEVAYKVAELVQRFDPAIHADGHLSDWLNAIRRVAITFYDSGQYDPAIGANLLRCVGNAYRAQNDFPRAHRVYNMGSEHLTGESDATHEFLQTIRKEQGAARTLQLQFSEASSIAHDLINDAEREKDLTTMARGYALLGYINLQSQAFDKAFEYAQQAYILWAHTGLNQKSTGQAIHYMGEAARCFGAYTLASSCLSIAQYYAASLEERNWEAHLSHSVGALALQTEQYKPAEENLLLAQRLFRQLDDVTPLTNTTHGLGFLYYKMGDYTQAEVQIQSALAGWKTLDNKLGTARSLHTLGNIFREQGRYTKARTTYHAGIAATHTLEEQAAKVVLGQLRESLSLLEQKIDEHPH